MKSRGRKEAKKEREKTFYMPFFMASHLIFDFFLFRILLLYSPSSQKIERANNISIFVAILNTYSKYISV